MNKLLISHLLSKGKAVDKKTQVIKSVLIHKYSTQNIHLILHDINFFTGFK